jgi:hypothetical protein
MKFGGTVYFGNPPNNKHVDKTIKMQKRKIKDLLLSDRLVDQSIKRIK